MNSDSVISATAEPEIEISRTVDALTLEPVTIAELHLIVAGVNTVADNGF